MKTDKELYSKEELKMFAEIEAGNYVSLPKDEFIKQKAELEQTARNTIRKLSRRRSINIRVIEQDINKIKAMALSEGMPYQTLITSILHKVAMGKIKV